MKKIIGYFNFGTFNKKTQVVPALISTRLYIMFNIVQVDIVVAGTAVFPATGRG